MMKAVLAGHASQLHIGESSKPDPNDYDVLVKVIIISMYPVPKGVSQILGLEISGTVENVGKKVTKYKFGDKVFGLLYGGAYAEYALINEDMVMLLPDQLTFQQGAAIPEVWFTAYQALHLIANIQEGHNLLIHAGASGVGLALVELSKLAKARNIFATVGSDVKVKFIEKLGVTKGINYKVEDFKETANIIIDLVGKDYWHKNMDCLAVDGRMVILSSMSGAAVSNVDLSPFLRKSIRVEGSRLRSRPLDYQINLRNLFYKNIFPLFTTPESPLKIIIDKVFDWKKISEAHKYLESNVNIGKVIINVTD
ncbi:7494_t:CDS:2 [Entrophospora sp. SA101]|nr:7494_t:CDS:2 [Entrophospora sp. SA101]CAJ0882229.1 11487_t:CDS:2 [Entrophospora sp. SA101]CAJ0920440.1 20820_t:CDS:2 [Entrophospora sp. SA101]